jgi:KDO2-lipid IV(A) lauroyltransferase
VWSARQRAKNALVFAAATLATTVLAPLPRAWLRSMGRAVGVLAHAVFGRARRTARENVSRAFPDMPVAERAALVRRVFRALGARLGETLALLRGGPPTLRLDDASARALREAGSRGVVFASAHLGPWEEVAAALVSAGVPLTTVARESYDPRLTRLYTKLRGAHGVRAIHRGEPGAAMRMVRTLREGRVLGVPMDLRSRVPSIEVPFLGHPARTPVGPARIALRTGAAVVVGTAARRDEGGTLCVTATAIPTADLAPDDAGERALTERINDELSRRIRALPEEWVWMHERWSD